MEKNGNRLLNKKLIMGNWKMNYTPLEAENYITLVKDRINTDEVDVVVCPNFVSLETVSNLIDDTKIMLGAQNVYYEDKGAYTGETSADMLLSVNVKYCLVGHSERRTLFNETDEIVNKKALKLLEKDIIPVICVGETLEERENKKHFEKVKAQLEKDLKDIMDEKLEKNVVIAYEPIWAIGTGKTATSKEAEEMCKFIRGVISYMYDEFTATKVRILYGGSVKKDTASEILNQEDIDGVLVGGASLKEEFVSIVNY